MFPISVIICLWYLKGGVCMYNTELSKTLSKMSIIAAKFEESYAPILAASAELGKTISAIQEQQKKFAKAIAPSVLQAQECAVSVASTLAPLLVKHKDVVQKLSSIDIEDNHCISEDSSSEFTDIVDSIVDDLPSDLPVDVSAATETIKEVSANKKGLNIALVIAIISLLFDIFKYVESHYSKQQVSPQTNIYIQQLVEYETNEMDIVINSSNESQETTNQDND